MFMHIGPHQKLRKSNYKRLACELRFAKNFRKMPSDVQNMRDMSTNKKSRRQNEGKENDGT